ncbi:hypothetical protein ACMFMG_004146 [Clarireedia jacksonii]
MAREDDNVNTNDQSKSNGSTRSDSSNPFIRFRHYADEQVSSVLQGFIGIPSIFSRPTGNQQWAVFDEELRRRDKLQARQRELKEAAEEIQKKESSNKVDKAEQKYGYRYRSPNNQSMSEELQNTDVERPHLPSAEDAPRGCAKIPPGTSGYSDMHGLLSQLHGNLLDNFGSYELPLYSPLHSTMVSSGPVSHMVNEIIGSLSPIVFGTTSNSLSLLPYLMASPYSPLQLSLNQALHREMGFLRRRNPTQTAPDDFPYREAFEDLLLTTQGKEMPNRKNLAAKEHADDVFSSLNNGIVWVDRLRTLGLLSIPNPDEHDSNNKGIASYDSTQGSRVRAQKPNVPTPSGKGAKDPETEEEMYESLLTSASATPAEFFSNLESTFSAVEKLMKSTTRGFEDSRYISQEQVHGSQNQYSTASGPDAEREVNSSTSVTQYTNDDGTMESTTTVWKEFADGHETETSETRQIPISVAKEPVARNQLTTPITASEKEVSSTSTVEHHTDTDGSVRTTIIVSKRFADGRETMTTSSHTSWPGDERSGWQTGGNQDTNAKSVQSDEQQGEKKAKKGWFWN